MKTFKDYLELAALVSLEKRDKLTGLVNDSLHELDLDSGKIRFNSMEPAFQVLGTESDNTLTWLWAWAEEQTEVPESLLDASLNLRDWGMREQVREFQVPATDLVQADGNAIALIAAQVANASSFFRDSYEGGALYLLVFDKTIEVQPSYDRAGLLRAVTELSSRYDLDLRNALRSYFQLKGLAHVERDGLLTCELENGERVIAEFDAAGKLLTWNGEASDL